MKRRIYLSIFSLVLLPLSNLNNYELYNASNSNFSFQYDIVTTKSETNYPFYKANDPISADFISKIEISYKNLKIDYKNILCSQVFQNNELKKYKKEILYFIENLDFVKESKLKFIIGSGNTSTIEVDVDGKNNKFGYYLVTFNATEIKFQNMNVKLNIDNKEYNFELKYYLIEKYLSKLNYFENVNELDSFLNKYGL